MVLRVEDLGEGEAAARVGEGFEKVEMEAFAVGLDAADECGADPDRDAGEGEPRYFDVADDESLMFPPMLRRRDSPMSMAVPFLCPGGVVRII